VTHSDTFRFAAKYLVGAAAGYAAAGGFSVLPDKPPRDRAAVPSVRFGFA